MKNEFEFVELKIPTFEHVVKLVQGGTITLKHHELGHGDPVILHKSQVKKIHKAHREGRGVRIKMSQSEHDMNLMHNIHGSGFLDWLKSAGNFIKDKIIDTPFYQTNIKPIVKQLVNTGVSVASAVVGSRIPGSQGTAQNVLQAGADSLGDKTGAFGIFQHQKKHSQKSKHGGILLSHDSSHVKGSALNPILPSQDFSRPNYSLYRVRGSDEAKEHMSRVRAHRKPKGGVGLNPPGY